MVVDGHHLHGGLWWYGAPILWRSWVIANGSCVAHWIHVSQKGWTLSGWNVLLGRIPVECHMQEVRAWPVNEFGGGKPHVLPCRKTRKAQQHIVFVIAWNWFRLYLAKTAIDCCMIWTKEHQSCFEASDPSSLLLEALHRGNPGEVTWNRTQTDI